MKEKQKPFRGIKTIPPTHSHGRLANWSFGASHELSCKLDFIAEPLFQRPKP